MRNDFRLASALQNNESLNLWLALDKISLGKILTNESHPISIFPLPLIYRHHIPIRDVFYVVPPPLEHLCPIL